MNRRHDICRTASDCRKSLFFQKKCLFSIPIPFRTLCWLCFCATVVVCCRCVLHRLCSTTCKHPCLKLGVSLFRHPCRKPLSPGKGLFCWGYRPKSLLGATPQSKDALVACQKFCTMLNQQSKQHSTPHF